MFFNLVVLAGRVVAPPEFRGPDHGGPLLRLLVAVRSPDPAERLDIVPVTVYDPPAALRERRAVPGDRVWATGAVRRHPGGSEKRDRSRLEIVVRHLEFREALDSAPGPSDRRHN